MALTVDSQSVDTSLAISPIVRVEKLTTRVSLVVPARNEARNISTVLTGIPDCVDEVILVDGNSTDATVAMAIHCRPDIRVVGQDVPGKGAALRAGFLAATGDVIVMIDADGSMSAEEIPHFLWYLEHGFDLVKGSRFVSGGGSSDITALRRAGNRALLATVNVLYDAQLTDLCYGFCAFRRCWLESLDLKAIGFEIETEMTIHALRAGLRVTEVPSFELPRRNGRSGLRTFRDGWRVLQTVVQHRWSVAEASTPSTPELPAASIGLLGE
jgi:glycosyltransferase involved in cell wall biosynthesis